MMGKLLMFPTRHDKNLIIQNINVTVDIQPPIRFITLKGTMIHDGDAVYYNPNERNPDDNKWTQ